MAPAKQQRLPALPPLLPPPQQRQQHVAYNAPLSAFQMPPHHASAAARLSGGHTLLLDITAHHKHARQARADILEEFLEDYNTPL